MPADNIISIIVQEDVSNAVAANRQLSDSDKQLQIQRINAASEGMREQRLLMKAYEQTGQAAQLATTQVQQMHRSMALATDLKLIGGGATRFTPNRGIIESMVNQNADIVNQLRGSGIWAAKDAGMGGNWMNEFKQWRVDRAVKDGRMRGEIEILAADAEMMAFQAKVQKNRAIDAKANQSWINPAMMAQLAMIGGMSAKGLDDAYKQRQDTVGENWTGFENNMVKLLSVGDIKPGQAGDIKSNILARSNAWALPSGQLAEAVYDMRSGASSLPLKVQDEIIQKGIEFSKLTGTDLPISLRSLTKAYLIYGNELKSVADAQNRWYYIADKGYIEPEKMSRLMPDLLAAGQAKGLSFNEVGAATIVGTQYGGRDEKTLTGIRNTFMELENANTVLGITLKGTYIEKLEQVRQALAVLDKDKASEAMQKIFGHMTIAAGQIMVQHVGEVRNALNDIAKLPDNLVGKKLLGGLASPGKALSEVYKSGKGAMLNLDTTRGEDPKTANDLANAKLIELGVDLGSSPFTPDFIKGLRTRSAYWGITQSSFKADAVQHLIQQARKGGNKDFADYLEVKYEEESLGLNNGNAELDPVKEGARTDARAERFLDMRTMGLNISPSNFRTFNLLQKQGKSSAAFRSLTPFTNNSDEAEAFVASEWGKVDPKAAKEWASTAFAADGQITQTEAGLIGQLDKMVIAKEQSDGGNPEGDKAQLAAAQAMQNLVAFLQSQQVIAGMRAQSVEAEADGPPIPRIQTSTGVRTNKIGPSPTNGWNATKYEVDWVR